MIKYGNISAFGCWNVYKVHNLHRPKKCKESTHKDFKNYNSFGFWGAIYYFGIVCKMIGLSWFHKICYDLHFLLDSFSVVFFLFFFWCIVLSSNLNILFFLSESAVICLVTEESFHFVGHRLLKHSCMIYNLFLSILLTELFVCHRCWKVFLNACRQISASTLTKIFYRTVKLFKGQPKGAWGPWPCASEPLMLLLETLWSTAAMF